MNIVMILPEMKVIATRVSHPEWVILTLRLRDLAQFIRDLRYYRTDD